MIENWLPVVGYEGLYEVSDMGSVRSRPRWVDYANGTRRYVQGCPLKLIPRRYVQVNLWRNRKESTKNVHALVAAAFIGPRPAGMEVCHGDGNKHNNVLSNLRYDTFNANKLDAVRHGAHPETKLEKCTQGHLLRSPNLIESRSHRMCKACHLARCARRYYRRKGVEIDFAEAADSRYSKIMKVLA